MQCSVDHLRAVAAFVAGSPRRWSELQMDEHALLDLCATEDLSALCFYRLSQSADAEEWPPRLSALLSEAARRQAAEELLRGTEIRVVLDGLARADVAPILIKGTPLAYTAYDAPALRPRQDTDLLVSSAQAGIARRVLESLGYTATVYCDDLFSQFEMQKIDRFGVTHAFDVHWKISTQPAFEHVLTYSGMLPGAQPVPSLGPHAMAAGFADALLLACIHPAMHHRNERRVLWVYDTHLVASRLTHDDFHEFAHRAKETRVAAICADQLQLAHALFQTPVPPEVLAGLARVVDEPSAEYLASQRRWHHELASNLRARSRVGDRVKLLRQVLLPRPSYVLAAYGLSRNPLGQWLLPALYVHRNVRGLWKILTGKK